MSDSGAAVVAKKKKPGRNPDEWKVKPIVVQLRGSPEFKAVIERLAEFDGSSVSAMVDRAIRHYARHVGFAETIPRR